MKNTNKGFSIIEVVLVLAIAGLIFLAVFIALPALQRGQRDTQRKSDASRLVSQIQHYASNNKNAVPNTQAKVNSFKANYLMQDGQTFADPKSGTDYTITYKGSASAANGTELGDGVMIYALNSTCDVDGKVVSGGKRQVAIIYKLESGVGCVDTTN